MEREEKSEDRHFSYSIHLSHAQPSPLHCIETLDSSSKLPPSP